VSREGKELAKDKDKDKDMDINKTDDLKYRAFLRKVTGLDDRRCVGMKGGVLRICLCGRVAFVCVCVCAEDQLTGCVLLWFVLVLPYTGRSCCKQTRTRKPRIRRGGRRRRSDEEGLVRSVDRSA
jgi:hypothetical protein